MKPFLASLLLSVAASTLILGSNTALAQDKPLTQADVEAIVKKTIEDNPELIIKAVENYETKQQAVSVSKAAQNIVKLQHDLQHNFFSPSVGNPKAEVTVVEFFDYHCGYCKRFYSIIAQLLKDDSNVRVVFKEFPILSEDSVTASKAALAVNSVDSNKYLAFHTALMKSNGPFTDELLAEKAKEVGVDEAAYKKALENPDIQKELDQNKSLAHALNISGTPALVIDREIIPGAIELDTLKEKVAQAHKDAKK